MPAKGWDYVVIGAGAAGCVVAGRLSQMLPDGRKRWGDEGYAAEELVAELGSAFLSADLDLTPEPREDHAAYIASWLKVLKNDKRAIFTAAVHAERAAAFLHSLQPEAASVKPEREAA
jgi:antirestriction protein ArdC